jgi:hypothetical protein
MTGVALWQPSPPTPQLCFVTSTNPTTLTRTTSDPAAVQRHLSWGSYVKAFRPDILLYRSEDPLGHVKWLPPGEQTRRTERLARASAARQNASEGSDCTPTRLTAATHHVSVQYGTTAWPARAHSHRRLMAECGSHPGEDGRACSGRRPHIHAAARVSIWNFVGMWTVFGLGYGM